MLRHVLLASVLVLQALRLCGLRSETAPALAALSACAALLLAAGLRGDLPVLWRLCNFKVFLAIFAAQLAGQVLLLVRGYFGLRYMLYDTGNFAHLAYQVGSGRGWFHNVLQINAFSDHFTPVMAVFGPLMHLWPDISWLLAARLLLYLACLPVLWALSGRYGLERSARFLVLLLWLCHMPLLGVLTYEFNPSTLALPFILLAFLLVLQRRYLLLALDLVLLLAFKEHMALVWVSLGAWLFFCRGQRPAGLALALAGMAAGLAVVYGVSPWLAGHGLEGQVSKWGPLELLPEKATFLLALLGSLGFIPLLAPSTLAMVVAASAISLISNVFSMTTLGCHYQDLPAAVSFVALLEGLAALQARRGWFHCAALEDRPRLRSVLAAMGAASLLILNSRYPMQDALETPLDQLSVRNTLAAHGLCRRLDQRRALWAQDVIGAHLLCHHDLRVIHGHTEPLLERRPHYVVLVDGLRHEFLGYDPLVMQEILDRAAALGRYEILSGDGFLRVYRSLDTPGRDR